MNGNAGSVLSTGTSAGTPTMAATPYESAVLTTMSTGAADACTARLYLLAGAPATAGLAWVGYGIGLIYSGKTRCEPFTRRAARTAG